MDVAMISKSGSDSNSGAVGSPKQTLKAVAPTLKSNGMLICTEGTYPEPIENCFPSPFTVKCLGKVVFNGLTRDGDICSFIDDSNILMEDIQLDATNAHSCGVRVGGKSKYITLRRMVIWGAKAGNAVFTQDQVSDILITQLLAYNIGLGTGSNKFHGVYARGKNITVQDSEFHHITGYGVHAYDSKFDVINPTIVRNKVHDCMEARGGVLAGCEGGHTCKNATIEDNVIWECVKGVELFGTGTGAKANRNVVRAQIPYVKSPNHALVGNPTDNVLIIG